MQLAFTAAAAAATLMASSIQPAAAANKTIPWHLNEFRPQRIQIRQCEYATFSWDGNEEHDLFQVSRSSYQECNFQLGFPRRLLPAAKNGTFVFPTPPYFGQGKVSYFASSAGNDCAGGLKIAVPSQPYFVRTYKDRRCAGEELGTPVPTDSGRLCRRKCRLSHHGNWNDSCGAYQYVAATGICTLFRTGLGWVDPGVGAAETGTKCVMARNFDADCFFCIPKFGAKYVGHNCTGGDSVRAGRKARRTNKNCKYRCTRNIELGSEKCYGYQYNMDTGECLLFTSEPSKGPYEESAICVPARICSNEERP